MDCPFCNPEARTIIASHDHSVAIYDQFPVTDGHSLVIPKKHVNSLFELNHHEVTDIYALVRQMRSTMLNSDPTITGFNIGLNEGRAAGQTISHCHVHVIPRREGDMEDPRGGVRHVIPAKGNYLLP